MEEKNKCEIYFNKYYIVIGNWKILKFYCVEDASIYIYYSTGCKKKKEYLKNRIIIK